MRYCDIVMKGGVTSGIVYPAAVCEIAKRFIFKNVGGTSAGAIAAVMTAAAEFRRATGDPSGFAMLGNIPNELEQGQLLFKLFHPNPSTKALYQTVLALAGRHSVLGRLAYLVGAYPVSSLLGALPGLALLAGVILRHSGWVAILAAAIVALLGIALADVTALVFDLLKRLPPNYFGLITGMEHADSDPVLTDWLHNKIQAIAGLGPDDPPLTFAMLWSGSKRPPEKLTHAPEPPDEAVVNLEMITTNVTLGRPYRWPTQTDKFYFSRREMLDFFPKSVVDFMQENARKADPTDSKQVARHEAHAAQGLFPLPHAGDLPVIVATRMSLAFPVLLSAVPLYAVDFSDPNNQKTDLPNLERCWFSDGGLSSNFPIALFDAPLPRWPTFAINLQAFPRGRQPSNDQSRNIYMPKDNSAGRQPVWTRFKDMPGFFGAIFNTMQNWHDSTVMPLPGYRDRIVTIFMSKDEGGLNLDMPVDVLRRLRDRGAAAGELIAARFDDPAPDLPKTDAPRMNWSNHREQRYLTTMGAITAYLSSFFRDYSNPQTGDSSYEDFVRQNYPALENVTSNVVDTGGKLEADPALKKHIPMPRPQLEVGPQLDS